MRVPGRVFGLLSLALLIFSGQSTVRADVLTPLQTETVTLTDTDWGPAKPPTVSPNNFDPLIFTKFDPKSVVVPSGKKAMLESVKITLDYTFTNKLSLTFSTTSTTPTSSTIQETTNGFMELSRPDLTKPLFNVGPIKNSIGPTTMMVTSTTPHTVPGSLTTTKGSLSQTLTGSADLALFQGTGTIGLPIGASALTTYLADNTSFGTSVTQAGAVVTLQYSYSVVPEPTSMALLGLGGGSLLLLLRSRRFSSPLGTRPRRR